MAFNPMIDIDYASLYPKTILNLDPNDLTLSEFIKELNKKRNRRKLIEDRKRKIEKINNLNL